jgi:hypothetical protein
MGKYLSISVAILNSVRVLERCHGKGKKYLQANSMPKSSSDKNWYHQKRWIISTLAFFPPMGIFLLSRSNWPQWVKVSGSVLSGLFLLSVLTGEPDKAGSASNTSTPAKAESIEPANVPDRAQSVSAQPPEAYQKAIGAASSATEIVSIAEFSEEWDRAAQVWQGAIDLLSEIPVNSSYYSLSQSKIAEYQGNYDDAVRQVAMLTAAEMAVEQQAVAEREPEPVPISIASGSSYASGTCKDLQASGVGSDFTPGDANYTSARDRDNDGAACES